VLIAYAQRCSLSHTNNCFKYGKSFIKFVVSETPNALPLASIRAVQLLNFKSQLTKNRQYWLGVLAGFFIKWDQLGYPGVEPDAVAFLNELRLPGNRKGEAVLTMDPEKGPFTSIELQAIRGAINNAFACEEISLRQYVLVSLFAALGARPVQFSDLKVRDLMITTISDGSRSYILSVPRGKMRGRPARWEFTKRPLDPELGALVAALIEQVKSDALSLPANQVADPLDLPLFPRWDSDAPPGFAHHHGSHGLAAELTKTLGELPITSERTGKQIMVTTRRFRTTLGTRAAQEGHSELVIAGLLDHSDTQQVHVYTQTTPEIIERIDKAVAMQLAPLAQAFMGLIVTDETAAERGDDPTSRIADPRFRRGSGTCGKHGFCSIQAPIGCYTCRNFQAWLDGPHEEMLDFLIAERERLMKQTGDERIAHANDRTILAVSLVVQKCREIKESNQDE